MYILIHLYIVAKTQHCPNQAMWPSRFHSGSDNSPGAGWNPLLAGDEYLNLRTANYPPFICMD